jgi:hypothetical protein
MYRPAAPRYRRSPDTPGQRAVDVATDDDFLSPEPAEDDPDEDDPAEDDPEEDEPELLESLDELDDFADSELPADEPSDEDDPFDPLAPSLPAATVLAPLRLSVR